MQVNFKLKEQLKLKRLGSWLRRLFFRRKACAVICCLSVVLVSMLGSLAACQKDTGNGLKQVGEKVANDGNLQTDLTALDKQVAVTTQEHGTDTQANLEFNANLDADPVQSLSVPVSEALAAQSTAVSANTTTSSTSSAALNSLNSQLKPLKIVTSAYPTYDLVNSLLERAPRTLAASINLLFKRALDIPIQAADTDITSLVQAPNPALSEEQSRGQSEEQSEKQSRAQQQEQSQAPKPAANLKKIPIDLTMLVPPGADLHSFSASAQTAASIKDADLIVAIGGASDAWLSQIYESLDEPKPPLFRLIDQVDLLPIKVQKNMEAANASSYNFDEHVWFAPKEQVQLQAKFSAFLEPLLQKHFLDQAPAMQAFLKHQQQIWQVFYEDLGAVYRELIAASKRQQVIFADRFPLAYFCADYQMDYAAAFPSCSVSLDPSAKTLASLQDLCQNEKLPIVFYSELSNPLLAATVAGSETSLTTKRAWQLVVAAAEVGAKAQPGTLNQATAPTQIGAPTQITAFTTKKAPDLLTEALANIRLDQRQIALWRSGHSISKKELAANVTMADLLCHDLVLLKIALAANLADT